MSNRKKLNFLCGVVLCNLAFVVNSCSTIPEPTPDLPVGVPPSAALSGNVICNHDFSNHAESSVADFTEEESNTTIQGSNASELLRSLSATAANKGTGAAKWNIKWSFDSQTGSRGCVTSNVESRATVNYQLPLWPDQLLSSDRRLAEQWTLYSDELRVHHCAHGKVGIDASVELAEGLKRMAPRKTCEQLKADADELAREIIGRYKRLEATFVTPVVTDYIGR